MGMNFEFGENPFLAKIVFDFWGKKAPKMHAHLPIHPRSSFAHAGKLGSCFIFMFLLIFLILHAHKSVFGVVQQVGKEYLRFGSLW